MRNVLLLAILGAVTACGRPAPAPVPSPSGDTQPAPRTPASVDGMAPGPSLDAGVADLAMPAPPDLSTPDLATASDLTPMRAGHNEPCTSSCDCQPDLVRVSVCKTSSVEANAGHPVIIGWGCCDDLRAQGTCTGSTGCQERDGRIVNCAGMCSAHSCVDQFGCANLGCESGCDLTTHTCR